METPPLDEPIKPEPLPSMSTPVYHPTVPVDTAHRPRRHTITRPDSALAMLSDEESDSQDHHDTLDRISDILSNLLQEANDAVQRDQLELVPSSRPPPLCMDSSRSSSRRTSTSLSSIPTPVSPVSPKFVVSKGRRINNRPVSLPAAQQRRSRRGSAQQQLLIRRDPLVESFRRLDSSLALVDSLSRDLATPTTTTTSTIQKTKQQEQQNSSIALYFILPLLHIPHALISMAFDSLSVSSPQQHLTSVITWALVFCLANVMVSTTVRAQQHQHQLPGSYQRHSAADSNSNNNLQSLQPVRKRRVLVRRSIYRKYTLPTRQPMVAITRSRTQPGTTVFETSNNYSNISNSNNNNRLQCRRHSF